MYLTGLINRPDTIEAYKKEKPFLDYFAGLLCTHPTNYLWAVHIPGHERIFICGIRGKHDSVQAFTTPEEMTEAYNRLLQFYRPKELFSLDIIPQDSEDNLVEETPSS